MKKAVTITNASPLAELELTLRRQTEAFTDATAALDKARADAEQEVRLANEKAERMVNAASEKVIATHRALSEAQKAMDLHYAAMRVNSPDDSYWSGAQPAKAIGGPEVGSGGEDVRAKVIGFNAVDRALRG